MAASKLGYLLWKRGQDDAGLSDSDGGATGQSSFLDSDDPDDGSEQYSGSWWWSPTGIAVRYTVITVILAAFLLFLLGGYIHAQRRLRRGLPLLSYHAWMVRQEYRPPGYAPQTLHPHQPLPGPYQQDGYAMNGYQNPPPAYNPYSHPPPAYQPPGGASKILADQNYTQAHRAENGDEGSQTIASPSSAAVRQP